MSFIVTAIAGSSIRRVTCSRQVLALSRVAEKRCFHASSSSLKKKHQSKRIVEEDEEYEEEFNEDEDDLFGSDIPSSSLNISGERDNSARRIYRAQRIQDIKYDAQIKSKSLLGLKTVEAKNLKKAMELRSDNATLRSVVQFTETSDDCDELKAVLRDWRKTGRRVGNRAAVEIVARCRKAGRPDVALEILSDPVQYGLPSVPSNSISKLYGAFKELSRQNATPANVSPLTSTSQLSPALALLRLELLHHSQSPSSETGEDASSLDSSIAALTKAVRPNWSGKQTELKEGQSAKRLVEAGGVWKEQCEKILAFEGDPNKRPSVPS